MGAIWNNGRRPGRPEQPKPPCAGGGCGEKAGKPKAGKPKAGKPKEGKPKADKTAEGDK